MVCMDEHDHVLYVCMELGVVPSHMGARGQQLAPFLAVFQPRSTKE